MKLGPRRTYPTWEHGWSASDASFCISLRMRELLRVSHIRAIIHVHDGSQLVSPLRPTMNHIRYAGFPNYRHNATNLCLGHASCWQIVVSGPRATGNKTQVQHWARGSRRVEDWTSTDTGAQRVVAYRWNAMHFASANASQGIVKREHQCF